MLLNPKYIFPLLLIVIYVLQGCGSVEYEIDEYNIEYEEKTIVTDTIKIFIDKDEEPIKTDLPERKEVYTYIVQIGAFAIKSNFERFYNKARLILGNDVYYEISGNLYKIRIGNYSNRAEAIKMAEYCKTRGYYDAFIITRRN